VTAPAERRPDSDRRHAHSLLTIGRGSATDEEFATASKRLDALLDERPRSSVPSLVNEAECGMKRAVRDREDALRRANDERSRWLRAATADISQRWDTEIRLAARRLADISYFERQKIEAVLDDEKERAVTLLGRRLKDVATGATTEALVDRLVEQGLARIEDVLEELR
jgi:hypothetical protein